LVSIQFASTLDQEANKPVGNLAATRFLRLEQIEGFQSVHALDKLLSLVCQFGLVQCE
jgi:hypothetical protein